MKHCVTPVLVGLDYELPEDPSVAYDGKQPYVGCNHLVCGNCGAVVHHADHRSTTSTHPPGEAEMRGLYDMPDPASSPLLNSAPLHAKSRAYFCRCDWKAADLGGVVFVGNIDQSWSCAGHGSVVVDKGEVRAAAARTATDALVAAAVPIFIPETGAKIRLHWAANVNPTFSTASELRDSLLASYPDAARYGAPLVGRNLEDTAPAWGWANDFLLNRTDWWPALGIALQHAASDGGALAQTALVELLAHFTDSIVLLPWTAPLAELWPDRRTVNTAATGWGAPDYRLDGIIRAQQEYSAVVRGNTRAFLNGYGVNGAPIIGPLTNEAELRALLVTSARAGQTPDGDKGPWSWVTTKLLLGDVWVWLRPAFVRLVNMIDHTDEAMVFALLDWFSEEHDLWQFVPLLQGWVARPPSWWSTPADTKPAGWSRTIRSGFWPDVKTLGDVATEALRRAKWQVVTPPVLDLAQLYGANIS